MEACKKHPIFDKSDDSSDAMEESLSEKIRLVSSSSAESLADQKISRRRHDPESLIKILNPTSKYHNHYAQVKSHDTRGIYSLDIFVESEELGTCQVKKVMMKLTDYAYPSYEELPQLASIFVAGKLVVLPLAKS
jgi:hypothetical protein